MPFRFNTNSIRTYLIDYPVAIVMMVAPFPLKLGKSSALWLSMVTRVTALLLPTLTEHLTGLIRVITHWQQLWVDRALGVVSTTATSSFHHTGLDAQYYWVLAVAVLLTTSALNTPGRYFGRLLSVDQVRRYKPPAIVICVLQSGLKSAGRSEAD
jgi:spore maturation protein SpmB